MDAVRAAVERIGGTIDLASAAGNGTAVRIRIPLRPAVISAVIVADGGQFFAIPQLAVIELLRIPADQHHTIERLDGREALRWSERLLPLARSDPARGSTHRCVSPDGVPQL